MGGMPRAGGAVLLGLGLGACGGTVAPADPGMSDAATSDVAVLDAATEDAAVPDVATEDATVPDAATDDATVLDAATDDPTVDGGAACSVDGALVVAGAYVAKDGTRHWLRRSATATTYSVVPGGAPEPAVPPRLYRVAEVCSGWLLLAEVGGGASRLDWAQGGDGLHLCVRPAANAGAAKVLAAPDADNVATGCAGSAWTVLARGAT